MACHDIREDAQAYLDDELSPARRALVEDHLRSCAECRKVVAELQAVSAALRGWSDADVSSGFQFGLEFKLANESVPAVSQPVPGMVRARPKPASRRPGAVSWLTSGWRPVAAAAAVLVAFAVGVTVTQLNRPGASGIVRPSADLLAAIEGASGAGAVADASIYAGTASARAMAAARLDPDRVVLSDVVYAFLGAADAAGDAGAGKKLVTLLAASGYDDSSSASAAGVLGVFAGFFGSPAYAGAANLDPLALVRQYEIQGRLKEALIGCASVTDLSQLDRVRLTEGSLKLRLGDLDGAQAALETAEASSDPLVHAISSQLLRELRSARDARSRLDGLRLTAAAAGDWREIALLEVRGYDFRGAANSFMKAANAGDGTPGFAADARFRSAWCQVMSGQVSTGIYGFRSVSTSDAESAPSALQYAARVEEAVGLARIGKFSESVAVCNSVLSARAPSRALEALAYFQKGVVELRDLNDRAAAYESLGRVASSGQGNLSYAAQILLKENGM